MRILLVEDEPDLGKAIERVLTTVSSQPGHGSAFSPLLPVLPS
ncbi:MAG: response regulator transcription factor [Leptolyngbya sp. SIO4C1]|nr:response regulator transcription factor [Leptolyngbya sp. SIO4C1]